MDGIPNALNGAPDGESRPTAICPACGKEMSPQARFCGACGAEMRPPEPAAPDAPAPDAPGPAQAAAPLAPEAGEGKTCAWCGTVNTPDATVCAACDATFPTPEGDEAMERAARARIEDMQAEINKPRGSSWWPFRSR